MTRDPLWVRIWERSSSKVTSPDPGQAVLHAPVTTDPGCELGGCGLYGAEAGDGDVIAGQGFEFGCATQAGCP